MTDKQVKLLELFKEIDEICKNNGIDYYMSGGSLLGVVRHRGFIPWDDDMDLHMNRSDWEKFVKACETQLPEGRILEAPDLDRSYYNMFPRYVDKNSTAIHRAQMLFDDTAGFVIDIFISDPVPVDEKLYEKYVRDLMLYSDLINPTVVYSYRWDMNAFRYKLYRGLSRFVGMDRLLERLEKRMFSYSEDECGQYAMRWGGVPFILPKYWFKEGKRASFEGIDCELPNYPKEYLTWHYGDEWMFIPPHGEHESHEAIYSVSHSYPAVRNELRALIDTDKYNKALQKRKNSIFSSMHSFHRLLNENRRIKAASVSIDLNESFERMKPEILRLSEEKDYFALFDIFSPYYSVQLSADFIGREDYVNVYRFNRPVKVEIKDERILAAAVETLVNVEKLSKAIRLIDVIETVDGRLPEKLIEIRKDALLYRTAVNDDERGEKAKAMSECRELLERHPHSISFIKLMISFLEDDGLEKNRSELEKLVSLGLSLNPEDGQFFKYRCDLDFKNDTEGALKGYIKAYRQTTNGMIHLDIGDIISDDTDSFVGMIMKCAESDFDEAMGMVDDALELLPFDPSLFAAKCDLIKAHITIREFSGVERELRKYVASAEENESIRAIYVEFLTNYTGSKNAAELFADSKLASDYAQRTKQLERKESLLPGLSGEEKAWVLKLMADECEARGDHRRSFALLSEALALAEGELLKLLITKSFVLYVRTMCIRAKIAARAEAKGVIRDGGRLSDVIGEWTESFSTVDSAIGFFVELGVIPAEGVPFIRRFNLLSAENEEDGWNLGMLKAFNKLCTNCARELFVQSKEEPASLSGGELFGNDDDFGLDGEDDELFSNESAISGNEEIMLRK